MFSSLKNRNFRAYFIANSFSVIGTFGQELALAWLVLDLTHSAAALGLALGFNFLPMLVVAPYAGVLSDRFNRRKLFIATQTGYTVLTLLLWGLVASGSIQIWTIYLLCLLIGLTGSLNTPTRLAFTHDMVGKEQLNNALSLGASLYSAGRVVGPSIAGIIISFAGVSPVFLLNAISYIIVIWTISLFDPKSLHPAPRIKSTRGQLLAGLRYARSDTIIFTCLLATLIVGIFTYEYIVTLPALAKITFHGTATILAFLTASYGAGAVIGGLTNARAAGGESRLPARTLILGLTCLLIAIQPNLGLTAAAVFLYGAASVRFSAFVQTTLQLRSDPAMRGRIIALFTAAWVGSNAIGAPIVGWVAQNAGPRWAIALGGVAALAAGIAILTMRTSPSKPLRTT